MISLAWPECRLPVGSSASRSAGLWITARAIADELLLPSGELAGIQIFLRHDLEAIESVGDQALPLTARNVFIRKRQVDVFLNGEVVEQVIALEDHSDILLRQFAPLLAFQLVDGLLAEPVFARPTGHREAPAHSAAKTFPLRRVP